MADTPYRDVNMGIPSPMLGGGFDPQAFWQNYGQRKQNLMIRQLDKEAQNKAAWMREYDPSKLIPSKIYPSVKDEIAKEINTLTEDQATWAAGQGKPKNWAKAKQRIIYLTTAGESVQKTMEQYADLATKNPEKFNPDEYYKWAETVDKLPTIEEKEKFIRTTRPFTEQIDIGEVFSDWIGDESTFETGATTTKQLDPELLKQRMDTRFKTLPREKQRSTLDTIYTTVDPETGKPVATNYQEALDYVTKMMLPMGSVSKTTDEPKSSGTGNSGSSGIGNDNKYFVQGTTRFPDTSGDFIDEVSVSYDGGSMKEIQLVDNTGTVVNGKPAMFYRDANGNWKVKVESQKPTGETGLFGSGGTQVVTVDVDYDKNKTQIESALGFSIPEWAIKETERKRKASPAVEIGGSKGIKAKESGATGGSGVTWKTAK